MEAVRRERDDRPLLRFAAFAENERIRSPGRAEFVTVEPHVVIPARGITRVIEAAFVRQPRETAVPGIGDVFDETRAALDLEHLEPAPFVPALRETEGDVAAVRARIPPVEGGQPGRVEAGRIQQGALHAECVPHVQHGLIGVAPASREKRQPPAYERHALTVDPRQRFEAGCETGAIGKRIERRARARIFASGPGDRRRIRRVFEVAARVGDEALGHRRPIP
jgi:hypothetical protein